MGAGYVESHYPTVMDSLAYRLTSSDALLTSLESEPDNPENWIRCDSIALQVRKACELILLGSTLAHLQDCRELDPRHWRPKDAFNEIQKHNEHPLPLPLEPEMKIIDGMKQFVPGSKPIPFSVLASVYGQCSNILHVPSASKVLEERVPPFDVGKFRGWIDGMLMLLRGHLLLLPEIKRVLICNWSGTVGHSPRCILAEGDGAGILAKDSLPEFALIVP